MPVYHIHFAAEHDEPIPPVADLPTAEAVNPVEAVKELLAQGRVPQNRLMKWARVVLTVHENGRPRQVLRVPIEIDEVIPIDSMKRNDEAGL